MERLHSQIALPNGVTWAHFGTTTNPHVHVDQVLSNFVQGYAPNARIWDQVAPMVPVAKQSDFYLVHSRADAIRLEREGSRRAPGSEARRVTRSIGSGTYYALNYALKSGITVEDEANADPMYRSELFEGTGMFLTNILDLDIEARLAGLITTVANVGSGAGVASNWGGAGANPIGDVNAAIDVVQDSTGIRPNQMTLGDRAWRLLRRHSTVTNLIFGANNGGGYPTAAQVAGLFDLERINIGNTYQNLANEAQVASISPIWGTHVVVHVSGSNAPGTASPSAFRSFRWAPPGLANMQVERHPFDTKRKSQEIEVGYYQDEKVVGPEYAYVIRAVNSNT